MRLFSDDPQVMLDLERVLRGFRPTKRDRERARPNPVLDARGDEVDQIERTARLVEQFQSRPVRERVRLPVNPPEILYAVGEPIQTYYWSDKRDPNDPEGDGRQGIWKLFRHEHDLGCGLRIYSTEAVAGRGATVPGFEPIYVQWPSVIGWLGDWRRVLVDLPNSKRVQIAPRGGEDKWGLYVMPEAQACVAMPYGPYRDKFYLWFGGHLTVTWRGIEG